MKFLQSLDRNEITYWLGLSMLFIGLCIFSGIGLALLITGAVMTVESVVTSYFASWMAMPRKK